jgi:hypothetical protein
MLVIMGLFVSQPTYGQNQSGGQQTTRNPKVRKCLALYKELFKLRLIEAVIY